MNIIAHRGCWMHKSEQNSRVAFERAFLLGFGVETDIRDFNSQIVISHDIPSGNEMSLKDFLRLANGYTSNSSMLIALNIKADGLALHIIKQIQLYPQLNYFAFDMSIPDMRAYFPKKVLTYTRLSEFEEQPVFLNQAAGVWLDGFESDWFNNMTIIRLISSGKKVCIVSPELHGRDHLSLWKSIKPIAKSSMISLCTDFPEQASRYFEG